MKPSGSESDIVAAFGNKIKVFEFYSRREISGLMSDSEVQGDRLCVMQIAVLTNLPRRPQAVTEISTIRISSSEMLTSYMSMTCLSQLCVDVHCLPELGFLHGSTVHSVPQPPHYRGFTITLRHTTLGTTSLDK